MALNTITPSNREEEYLSAIAGDEGASAPVPSNRREEWLRRIAEDQGDQTERLDHIEAQIPVDPAAADVGKVMTVIADTSGEEPVYKWSAEASAGLTLVNEKHTDFTLTSNSYSTSVKWTIADAGADNVAALKRLFASAAGDGNKVRQFFRDHLRLYANDHQAYQTSINLGGDGTILVNAHITVPAIVNNVAESVQLAIRFKVNLSDSETTDFITDGSTQAYKASEQIFGTNNITGTTRVYLTMEIWL